MMEELQAIKTAVDVSQTLLIVDAMTGQDAVNVAETFQNKIGIDGVILTKMDGDTRGGAALSIKAVTGRPILYVGMGRKAFRSGAVLSGPHGVPDSGHGRYPFSD